MGPGWWLDKWHLEGEDKEKALERETKRKKSAAGIKSFSGKNLCTAMPPGNHQPVSSMNSVLGLVDSFVHF